jgi:hypothetical protein
LGDENLGTLGLGLIFFCQSTEAQKFTKTKVQKLPMKNEDSLLSGSNAQKNNYSGLRQRILSKEF